jgi:hypothetical protein
MPAVEGLTFDQNRFTKKLIVRIDLWTNPPTYLLPPGRIGVRVREVISSPAVFAKEATEVLLATVAFFILGNRDRFS